MALKKGKLIQQSGARLKQIRETLDFSRPRMCSLLGVTTSAYCKNENGETFPGVHSMLLLSRDYDISMDWLIFGRGPMYFRHKGREEQSEQEVAGLKEELEKVRLEKKQAEEQRAAEVAAKEAAGTGLKPEVEELVEHMERIPLLYYEVLAQFQRFKLEHPEILAEPAN